jgi:uncharacterized protein YgbK (DUF1537 family)
MFDASLLPLVVGAPQLGRYCVFGNLFARLGIGTDAPPTRLDRLPSMQNHPVTPMRESDLRRHLAAQTDKPIGLFDVLQFSRPIDEQRASLERLLSDGTRVVLFDVLDAAHLSNIGALINGYASSARPVFTVGSSSVETALGAHWQEQGRLQARDEWKPPGSVRPILVVSGSCSPVTAGQIDWAVEHGFADVPLDTPRIAADESVDDDTNAVADTVVTQLRGGQSVVIHTSRGGDDPRIVAIGNASAQLFGTTLGRIVRRVLERHHLRRLCISGGDTSSYVARQLNIESLEMVAPLVPGAPLCRAKSAETAVDGLEVNVKGGQVGRSDYFAAVERGKQD